MLLAAKLLLDSDVARGMAAITLGVKPIFDWFTSIGKELKGRDACTALSQNLATFGWLKPLAETLRCMSDDAGLEAIGLTMRFRAELLAKHKEQDAFVAMENVTATNSYRYVANLVEKTACSMSWWT